MSFSGYESETLERLDVGRWIEEFFNTSIFGFSTLPEVEIHESKDGYLMEVDLPGLSKEDLVVEMDDNLLTISCASHKRMRSGFRRSFVIPKDVDRGRISTEFDRGMLVLRFPRTATP